MISTVVLVDHRGTGGSGALRSPELEAVDPLGPMYPLELVRACREELAARASLEHYGTEVAAGDLDRVRADLGYPRIDLWGLSYGTILGQVYMRRFPERVRSAVLVGVAPIDLKTPLYHAAGAQRTLDLLFYECQMEPVCNAAFPDLRRGWNVVMQRFEKGSVEVNRRDPGVHPRQEDAAPTSAPEPTTATRMLDFAYALSEPLRAGRNVIHIVNDGVEPHHVLLFKLDSARTMEEFQVWMEDHVRAEAPVTFAAAIAEMSSGPKAISKLTCCLATTFWFA